MKAQYLDIRNCRALLPKHVGIPIERQLDDYLDNTNQGGSGHAGLIDRLIKHNTSTIGKTSRLYRLANPIDIGLTVEPNAGPNKVGILCSTGNRPPNEPIKLHLEFSYEDGSVWKILLPLQYLLKGWGDANEGYQCYSHAILKNIKPATAFISPSGIKTQYPSPSELENIKEYNYFGITGRNWLQRLDEHLYEMRSGSNKRFHRAWRDNLGATEVLYVSVLMDVNQSFETAMNWEEKIVDHFETATKPHGLNMIPGGFKGFRLLHEHRITDRENITLKERARAISEYARQHPRKGIPNPFISELWEDDDYYLRVVGSREKALSANQVRRIRKLHEMGWTVSAITKEVNALNDTQVKNVIKGMTYKRIH